MVIGVENQRATQSDGLLWDEGLPVRGKFDGERNFISRRHECEVRDLRDTDLAPKRIRRFTLFQLSIGGSIVEHRRSLFIATKT